MLSLTGLGNVVKLITWSFPDASLQKHTESIENMGCILETVWYVSIYIYCLFCLYLFCLDSGSFNQMMFEFL